MPTLLAIECSTDACSAAIYHNGIVQETFAVRPREHNKILLPMIDELLRGLQLKLVDLDAIAFGAGPGSFTGLRLAAGIVQGLAFAAQKPVIPVSSLASLAFSAGQQNNSDTPQTILVALDARMNDIYFGAYCYKQGNLETLCEDQLLPVSELAPRCITLSAGTAKPISIGDSWATNAILKLQTIQMTNVYPHAKAVLALAIPRFNAGIFLPAENALPIYLRETITWQKWQPKGGTKITTRNNVN